MAQLGLISTHKLNQASYGEQRRHCDTRGGPDGRDLLGGERQPEAEFRRGDVRRGDTREESRRTSEPPGCDHVSEHRVRVGDGSTRLPGYSRAMRSKYSTNASFPSATCGLCWTFVALELIGHAAFLTPPGDMLAPRAH